MTPTPEREGEGRKPRIRFSSRGWFRYWTKFRFGYRDFHTWVEMHDAQGRKGWGDIWIGPYASFDEAARKAIGDDA